MPLPDLEAGAETVFLANRIASVVLIGDKDIAVVN